MNGQFGPLPKLWILAIRGTVQIQWHSGRNLQSTGRQSIGRARKALRRVIRIPTGTVPRTNRCGSSRVLHRLERLQGLITARQRIPRGGPSGRRRGGCRGTAARGGRPPPASPGRAAAHDLPCQSMAGRRPKRHHDAKGGRQCVPKRGTVPGGRAAKSGGGHDERNYLYTGSIDFPLSITSIGFQANVFFCDASAPPSNGMESFEQAMSVVCSKNMEEKALLWDEANC